MELSNKLSNFTLNRQMRPASCISDYDFLLKDIQDLSLGSTNGVDGGASTHLYGSSNGNVNGDILDLDGGCGSNNNGNNNGGNDYSLLADTYNNNKSALSSTSSSGYASLMNNTNGMNGMNGSISASIPNSESMNNLLATYNQLLNNDQLNNDSVFSPPSTPTSPPNLQQQQQQQLLLKQVQQQQNQQTQNKSSPLSSTSSSPSSSPPSTASSPIATYNQQQANNTSSNNFMHQMNDSHQQQLNENFKKIQFNLDNFINTNTNVNNNNNNNNNNGLMTQQQQLQPNSFSGSNGICSLNKSQIDQYSPFYDYTGLTGIKPTLPVPQQQQQQSSANTSLLTAISNQQKRNSSLFDNNNSNINSNSNSFTDTTSANNDALSQLLYQSMLANAGFLNEQQQAQLATLFNPQSVGSTSNNNGNNLDLFSNGNSTSSVAKQRALSVSSALSSNNKQPSFLTSTPLQPQLTANSMKNSQYLLQQSQQQKQLATAFAAAAAAASSSNTNQQQQQQQQQRFSQFQPIQQQQQHQQQPSSSGPIYDQQNPFIDLSNANSINSLYKAAIQQQQSQQQQQQQQHNHFFNLNSSSSSSSSNANSLFGNNNSSNGGFGGLSSSSLAAASAMVTSVGGKPLRSERLPVHVVDELIKQAKIRRRNGGKKEVCVFCRNNGEKEQIYTSHTLKDATNRVICPILRLYTCPICQACGDSAHTIKYCPFAEKDAYMKLFKDNGAALRLMSGSGGSNPFDQMSAFGIHSPTTPSSSSLQAFQSASHNLHTPPQSPPPPHSPIQQSFSQQQQQQSSFTSTPLFSSQLPPPSLSSATSTPMSGNNLSQINWNQFLSQQGNKTFANSPLATNPLLLNALTALYNPQTTSLGQSAQQSSAAFKF